MGALSVPRQEPMQEIELKLDLSPADAERLAALQVLASPPVTRQMRAVYFDTAGQDLAAAGLSLRIREAEGRRIQTIKASQGAAAGLFSRREWEHEVGSDVPVMVPASPLAAIFAKSGGPPVPMFSVQVERRQWVIEWDGASIELVLDCGEIIAGERRVPLCEVELELRRGPAAALFALARHIDAEVALRLGVQSKSERGYRLLAAANRSVKAVPLAISGALDAEAAFLRIAAACLRQFRMNEPLIDAGNAEALHQARVALRRLRSALSIHRHLLADQRLPHLQEEARWLAGVLGEARDLDVLEQSQIGRDESGGSFDAALATARLRAYGTVEAALGSPRARTLMLDLSEWLALGEWRSLASTKDSRTRPIADHATAILDRLRRKVIGKGRALDRLDDTDRHDVRKMAKKLRYAADFFAPLFEGKRQRQRRADFCDAVEAVQETLGALNDRASLPRLLESIGAQHPGSRAIVRTDDASRQDLLTAALKAHEDFARAKRFWT
jgi:triphosphatase